MKVVGKSVGYVIQRRHGDAWVDTSGTYAQEEWSKVKKIHAGQVEWFGEDQVKVVRRITTIEEQDAWIDPES